MMSEIFLKKSCGWWKKLKNKFFGPERVVVIAGPCAIESRDQLLKTAEAIKNSGLNFFRAGAFKPRTSPYSFQGLEEEGLKLLAEVREKFNVTQLQSTGI